MDSLLAAAGAGESVNWMLEIAKMAVPVIAVLLGLWIWHLQKRSEPKYAARGCVYQKRLDALLKVWGLLAYITDVENPKSVMIWERQAAGDVFYIRPGQAREYMTELSRVFYADGCGLLLGQEIKRLCYEFRNHLYGVLLKAKKQKNGEEMIRIENPELVKTMKMIYSELNTELRKELGKIEK